MITCNNQTNYSKSGYLLGLVLLFFIFSCRKEETIRQDISLNSAWKTVASDTIRQNYTGFDNDTYDDNDWKTVNVPHNWDTYHGYLRKVHGNRHGYAWYRKHFRVRNEGQNKRYFLWFEGVGSYATVWLNGRQVGYHAGGRTTFTIDITDNIRLEEDNILAVRADHPAHIRDLPWVCGGCSDEWGFSEGSQPMGIFRPVHLVITNDIRIEPFGIHIWNDTTVSDHAAQLFLNTELKNYSDNPRKIELINTLYDRKNNKVAVSSSKHKINTGELLNVKNMTLEVKNPVLWSPENPYLYTLVSKIVEDDKVIDKVETSYGIRWISWPINRKDNSGTFLINGKPFFINGIGEYEHQFGGSHAFTHEQIRTRVMQIKAAGFNAFRDAHQPHNLKYQEYWDKLGILWWTQMSAHIWFDDPEFRENFKTLLREWVKERRNNPSNIMWGLQNESTLPTDFAEECVQIIREMDPTASSQRLVTTCNGGTGTDWNVIQNWSGTYGGDPERYAEELSTQLLNGEYGAWRSIDLHTEGPYNQEGILSENRMTQLLEMKIELAGSVKDKVCGQYLWLLNSHDNPGRFQNGEGFREIDRIGPVNYKGLLTAWGEPTDAYYLYRANYVSAEQEPMVYIVSHTWPGRWDSPGIKDSITVYSNCDEVELFNDITNQSLGKIQNPGKGQSFIWRNVDIQYNLLQAAGYVGGKKVAEDLVVLHHLPVSPNFSSLNCDDPVIKSDESYHYLYRVNCGGNKYIDEFGNQWMADRHLSSDTVWGSVSWTDNFEGVPDFYGSQRRTFDPIKGTNDWRLFQSFRYGRENLSFRFPVPDGTYRVELYFTEPWYGTGGGMNCTGWRLFDVAINDHVLLDDLDIWNEAGHDQVLEKIFNVDIEGGMLKVHFPEVRSGQAVISAIAIASINNSIKASPASRSNITDLKIMNRAGEQEFTIESWLDIGDRQYQDDTKRFRELPPVLFGCDWIKTPVNNTDPEFAIVFRLQQTSDIFIGIPSGLQKLPGWLAEFNKTPLTLKNDDANQPEFNLYSKRADEQSRITTGSIKTTHSGATNYTLFVVPVSSLNASTDQRPIKIYGVEEAIFTSPGLRKKQENTRTYIEVTTPQNNRVYWYFNVGLASTYELGINFNNQTNKAINASLKVTNSEGIIMHSENIVFAPTGERWRTLKKFTASPVNAGRYAFELSFSGQQGLKIQYVSVQ